MWLHPDRTAAMTRRAGLPVNAATLRRFLDWCRVGVVRTRSPDRHGRPLDNRRLLFIGLTRGGKVPG